MSGAERVIVIDRGRVGDGASSRAAGMVRAQGGTPTTVALGLWSINFYRRQAHLLSTGSGFRELGNLILAATEDEERSGRERVAMQRQAGLDVRWVDPAEAARLDPALRASSIRGASYSATDGCIDPVRNVRAYSLAMQAAGVELREHCAFTGIETSPGESGPQVTAVLTDQGRIETRRAILPAEPQPRQVGALVDVPIPPGALCPQSAS